MTQLYAGNLPFTATEDAVRDLLTSHGRVEKMQTQSALMFDGPMLAYRGRADFSLAPAGLRILIVNENVRSAGFLKSTLQELGYSTVVTAHCASQALVAAADFFPSIALLDLELPDMTGYQLAYSFQAHLLRGVRRVPLLAVAERHALKDRELTRAAGFIGCVTKPVVPEQLNHYLRTLHRRFH